MTMCRLYILALLLTAAMLPADETAAPPSGGDPLPSVPAANTNGFPFQNLLPRFRDRAVVLEINARVVEQNQIVVWDESHRKATFPGRPVGIRLVGSNVVVAAQFTPYIHRRTQNILVAQGQIWMEVPGQGIRYFTSMQTIPLEFDEPIYFFPLGSARESDSPSIEVMLTMHPYEE